MADKVFRADDGMDLHEAVTEWKLKGRRSDLNDDADIKRRRFIPFL